MSIALIPLLIMVAGILIYALASNAKVVEIGRWMMVIGMFWLVAVVAHYKVLNL